MVMREILNLSGPLQESCCREVLRVCGLWVALWMKDRKCSVNCMKCVLFSGLRLFRDGSVWTLEELRLLSDLILKQLRVRKDPRVMNVVNLYW